MYITFANPITLNKKNTINSSEKPAQLRKNNTELPKLCANQIYFTAGLTTRSERIIKNFKDIQKLLNETFSPAKLEFTKNLDKETIDIFNKYFSNDTSNIIFKNVQKPTFAITNFTDDTSKYVIKFSNDEIGNQKFLKLSYSKDATPPNIIFIKPHNILSENNLTKSLSNYELSKLPNIELFDNNGERIIETIENFNYFINSMINNDIHSYFINTFKNSLDLITLLNNKLNKIEEHKKHTLKRSYAGYLPFPRKSAYHLRDTSSIENFSYVIIPHKKDNPQLYRLLKIEATGNIKEANLIDIKQGVLKHYCPSKIYTWDSIQYTPSDKRVLPFQKLIDSNVLHNLTKYYNLLTNFSEHIEKVMKLSEKELNENLKANDSIGFNSIKRVFTDKISQLLKSENDKFLLNSSNGEIFELYKEMEKGIKVITLNCELKNNFITIKTNPENSKLFQTNSFGNIIFNNNDEPIYLNSKSFPFKFKTTLMKDFIKEALKTKSVDLNIDLQSQMQNLKETFTLSNEVWKNMSKTKKTDFIKIFPSIVEARGNTGEIRLKIPEKNYQLGLKPQKLDSSEFMRFSIYDNDGKLQKAYLMNDFTKIVDNYCTKGYTKDSISRIPPSIIYKTEEQIKAENIDTLLAEYQKELTKFHTAAKDFAIDKRLR